jgi:hypothetical protein
MLELENSFGIFSYFGCGSLPKRGGMIFIVIGKCN